MKIKHNYSYGSGELHRGDYLGNCCGAHVVKTISNKTQKRTSRGIKLFLGKFQEPSDTETYLLDHVETSVGTVSVLIRKQHG